MIVPDQLYGVGPKAISGGLIELWTVPLNRNQAAAAFSIDSPIVPPDRVVVLNLFAGLFGPGAAQIFNQAVLNDIDPDGIVVGPIWVGISNGLGAGATDTGRGGNPVLGYVLGPGHRANLGVNFNAGGVNNVVVSVLQGLSIPRGEIQLAGSSG